MSMISFLIKPASSLCNLRCKYCFYADVSQNREMASMGIMQEEVMHALIDKALQVPVDTIQFSFQRPGRRRNAARRSARRSSRQAP